MSTAKHASKGHLTDGMVSSAPSELQGFCRTTEGVHVIRGFGAGRDAGADRPTPRRVRSAPPRSGGPQRRDLAVTGNQPPICGAYQANILNSRLVPADGCNLHGARRRVSPETVHPPANSGDSTFTRRSRYVRSPSSAGSCVTVMKQVMLDADTRAFQGRLYTSFRKMAVLHSGTARQRVLVRVAGAV